MTELVEFAVLWEGVELAVFDSENLPRRSNGYVNYGGNLLDYKNIHSDWCDMPTIYAAVYWVLIIN